MVSHYNMYIELERCLGNIHDITNLIQKGRIYTTDIMLCETETIYEGFLCYLDFFGHFQILYCRLQSMKVLVILYIIFYFQDIQTYIVDNIEISHFKFWDHDFKWQHGLLHHQLLGVQAWTFSLLYHQAWIWIIINLIGYQRKKNPCSNRARMLHHERRCEHPQMSTLMIAMTMSNWMEMSTF